MDCVRIELPLSNLCNHEPAKILEMIPALVRARIPALILARILVL